MSSEPDSRHVSGESSAATNPSVSFEPQDVKAETIFKYLVMLLLTVFASMLIVWGLYRASAPATRGARPMLFRCVRAREESFHQSHACKGLLAIRYPLRTNSGKRAPRLKPR